MFAIRTLLTVLAAMVVLVGTVAPMAADRLQSPGEPEPRIRAALEALQHGDSEALERLYHEYSESDLAQPSLVAGIHALIGEGAVPSVAAALGHFEESARENGAYGYGLLRALRGLGISEADSADTLAARLKEGLAKGEPETFFAVGLLTVFDVPGPYGKWRPEAWLRAAAEKGHPKAAFFLGLRLFHAGDDEAAEWMLRAVLRGDDQANYFVAVSKWFKAVANERMLDRYPDFLDRHPIAQQLGPQEAARQARRGFALTKIGAATKALVAARQGLPSAQYLVDIMRANLSPDAWAEAERQAAAWRPLPPDQEDAEIRRRIEAQGRAPRR